MAEFRANMLFLFAVLKIILLGRNVFVINSIKRSFMNFIFWAENLCLLLVGIIIGNACLSSVFVCKRNPRSKHILVVWTH